MVYNIVNQWLVRVESDNYNSTKKVASCTTAIYGRIGNNIVPL